MIQLREMVDEVLQNVKLDFLHLDVRNGILFLAGTCGKPYINIYGINVPKKINSKERDYIFKIVNKYITKNINDIKWVIDKKINKIKPEDVIPFNCSNQRDGNNNFKYSINIGNNNISISLMDNKLYLNRNLNNVLFDIISQIILDKDIYLKALKLYKKAHEEYIVIENEIIKLSRCNI
jgi:hypothetical protein